MLKILQARPQQYMNEELPYIYAGFRNGRRTRDQIANIRRILKKAKEFQKTFYFWFIDYIKAFDCVDDNKMWKILKELGIPYHLTCFLLNLYLIKKQQLEPDMEQWTGSNLGKENHRLYIVSAYFNLYAECLCACSVALVLSKS